MMQLGRLGAAALLAAGSINATHAQAESWTRYVNGRYGTSAIVPKDLFPAQGIEPANGDGVTYRSADGAATLRIWGGYNIDALTPGELLATARDARGVVSANATSGGYNLLGQSGSQEWIEQCSIGPGDGEIIHCYRLDYPRDQSTPYRSAGARIGASLEGP